MVADSDEPLEAPKQVLLWQAASISRPRKERIVVILEERFGTPAAAARRGAAPEKQVLLTPARDLRPETTRTTRGPSWECHIGRNGRNALCNCYSLSTRDVPTVRRQLRAREEMTWEVSRETTTFRAIPDFTGTGHTQ